MSSKSPLHAENLTFFGDGMDKTTNQNSQKCATLIEKFMGGGA